MTSPYAVSVFTRQQKVRLCLAEKELDWTDRHVDFSRGEQYSSEYLKLNPNGVVPTLVHDGRAVVDSSVILEYLDEAFSERPLTPPNAVERATMRAWLRFFEEVPTVAVRFPSFNQVFVRFYGGLSEEQFSEQADARPLRKHFYRRMGREGFSQKDVDEALERFRVTVNRMECTLQASRWLLGGRLTLADLCVAPLGGPHGRPRSQRAMGGQSGRRGMA
jgi:glutathione S-transferase